MTLRACWGLVWLLPAITFGNPGAPMIPPPDDFPKDYFQMPVQSAIRLSGTFGELRPNHFHSGIDISSATGSIGQPIYAAAEGFIDRIRVQESGYGNSVYIKHPKGYTTVYAHLDKFSAAVEQYVKEMQYKRERFEVDLYPSDGAFKVKKGEQIGRMGNTGSSEGAHLHFEIRHSTSQKALNPLLFGLPIPDQTPPDLRDMKVYFLSEQREVLNSKAFPIERRKDGSYGVAGDTVRLPAWRVGFGLKAIDRQTGNTQNKNGLYSLTLLADERTAFQWNMTELDFNESRYLNAHADYAARANYGAWFHRCFVLPGDRLSNYARTESLGAIPLYKERPVKITLKAADAYNNVSTITFWALRGDPIEPLPQPDCQFEILHGVDNRVDLEGFSMIVPKGALYETLYFEYGRESGKRNENLSPVHQVHNKSAPLHRSILLSLLPSVKIPEGLLAKAVIARSGNGRPVNCGGIWSGDRLETRVREFGDYSIMLDTVPPTITPVSFAADMRRKNTLVFRLQDDFRIDGNADNLQYRCAIDGKWILFEFDRKTAKLSHTFDGRIGPGTHILKLTVKDDRGNEAVLERQFTR